jgi:hypothetical protein
MPDIDPYQIVLTNVRLSFPHVFKPEKRRAGDDPNKPDRYSAAFILDKVADAKQIKKVEAAIELLIKEEKLRVDPDKRCLKDGKSKPDLYPDTVMFINSACARKPQVVDRDRSPLTEDDDVIYGGCRVNAVLTLWGQNNEYGRRVNATLEVVQFVRDDEPFGRRPVDVNAVLPDMSEDINDDNGLD